ncbi:TetR/AcrR family transcriptional regulator [Actinoplanes sp. NPDC023936]|uniref:TetR/AcrR family transcriptional regulator n=1 Tax=Actinoplanes sp. NPDC023936 TaxID=3154910 RepID=UPI0033EF74D2
MPNLESPARKPKQERSRVSFDAALDAALSLLVERGSDEFTLSEVSKRSGVSTGAIYGRVDSKDQLLRIVNGRAMTRIAEETEAAFARPGPAAETFPEAVERAVRTMSEVLRAHGPVIGPFMRMAKRDHMIGARGKAAFDQMAAGFAAVLLARRGEIGHPDPERAVTSSCVIVYSALSRWMGLGSEVEAPGDGNWVEIVDDLVAMVTAFLQARKP